MKSRFAEFNPIHIRTFMGGDFNLGRPKTVGELREAIKDIDKELARWGDEVVIAEVAIVTGTIHVTLQDGVPE
jgi:hypothetical protein